MFINLLLQVAEPDSEADKKNRVRCLKIKDDNTIEQFCQVEGQNLMTVSLMKDVFMVLKERSRMKLGIHAIIDVGLFDTCKKVDLESLSEDYRDAVKSVLYERKDTTTTILQTGLEIPPGYKTVLYISTIEGE